MASDNRRLPQGRLWQVLFLGLMLAGCNPVDWARQQWASLQGGTPKRPVTAPSEAPEEFGSAAAMKAKANGELLGEMLHVVFLRPPQDRSQFGTLVDSLNQGASLEGIYNGLTHSSDYRKLEFANPGSSERALRIFAETLAELSVALPSPTEFTAAAAKPLAVPVQPGAPSGVETLEFKKAQASPEPVSLESRLESRMTGYRTQFQGASIFTLKRILADEALKVFEHLRRDRAALAAWYSKWVVSTAHHEVDFGLPSRNSRDEKLHSDWATRADPDRLVWEILNRTHRVLNEAQKKP